MTREKLKEVFKFYFDHCINVPPRDAGGMVYVREMCHADYASNPVSKFDMLCHIAWMCQRCINDFLAFQDEDALGKANRWLGYIQGELRAMGHFTITEMRDHNRGEAAKPAEPVLTTHDGLRRDQALQCDRTDPESVREAIRGLQSTDHPSLLPLHDELVAVLQKLEERPAHQAKPLVYGTVARRWRKKIDKHPNGSKAEWFYGCYFPQSDLCIGEMGGRGTGMPNEVEWLDQPQETFNLPT